VWTGAGGPLVNGAAICLFINQRPAKRPGRPSRLINTSLKPNDFHAPAGLARTLLTVGWLSLRTHRGREAT